MDKNFEPNILMTDDLMRLLPYINFKTLQLLTNLQRTQYGKTFKPFKTIKDLVECDIEDLKSLLVYKLGKDYQKTLFEIEEGLALAKLKVKNSDFSPYDIRYERLNFSKEIVKKLQSAFPMAKTAGDISILGTKRLIQAGLSYHDLSRYLNPIMNQLNMVIESDKKHVLRHSTYAKPVIEKPTKKTTPHLATTKERNIEAQKTQKSFESTTQVKIYKLAPDEEVRDGQIVKKVESPKKSEQITQPQTTIKKEKNSALLQHIKTSLATEQQSPVEPKKTKIQLKKPKFTESENRNDAILDMTIDEFGFSKRTTDGLKKIKTIQTIRDLSAYGKTKLKDATGIGSGAIFEIEVLLFKHGIKLRDSRSFDKGVFRTFGVNQKQITAQEIFELPLPELKARVCDQRVLGNYHPSTKKMKKNVDSLDVVEEKNETPAITTTSTATTTQLKKSVVSQQKDVAEVQIKEIDITNLPFALNKFGIKILDKVSTLCFSENSADFDEIKIAVNDYFNHKISTIETAPSSVAISKMKEKILEEMECYESIVTSKRDSLSRSKLEIERKTASAVLRKSLHSLINKFYQGIPSSELVSNHRVKLHSFSGPIITPEYDLNQRQF